MKLRLSSSWTKYYLIGPIKIGLIIILIEVFFSPDNYSLVLPILLILTGLILNIFVVEAYIDEQSINIKNWLIKRVYNTEQIHKVGELRKGFTSISFKEDSKFINTFLIIDAGDILDKLDGIKEKDVYSILINRKITSYNNGEHS